MSESYDGGPAYPEIPRLVYDASGAACGYGGGGPGMALRDYFAAAALNQRKMLSTGAWYAADAAREAYEIADAMLEERGKR